MRPADAPLELLRVGREVWARSGDTAFTFVPVTQLWHVAAELPAAAVEISPAEAGRLVPLMPRPNLRFEQERARARERTREAQRAEGVLTSAEVGLSMKDLPGLRPIATAGLPQLLSGRGRAWTIIARFGASSSRSAPFKAVAAYEASKRFDLEVEAERGETSGDVLVMIRARPGQEQG